MIGRVWGGLQGLLITVATILPCAAPDAHAQEAGATPAGGSVEVIDREFRREVAELERKRLRRLAELAARQTKAEAERTYEVYLSSAAGRELFEEAEPVADRILKADDASPRVQYLAHLVKILARVRRGDYEGALASTEAACRSAQQLGGDDRGPAPLSLPERLAILEIYTQALLRADQFQIARKALATIRESSRDEVVRATIDRRLARLAMLENPAPAIEGTDLDGRPFHLADWKGDVVLVVFWATWNTPDQREAGRLKDLERAYRDRGLRIVGINLDALQDGSGGAVAVLPRVRRFLVEQNIGWPNLVEGHGGGGYAQAYGVREIPANFVVGRDGKVVNLDVAPANLDRAVAKALAP